MAFPLHIACADKYIRHLTDYDAKNDIWGLRLGKAENARTIQYSDWLVVTFDEHNGLPVYIQVNGLKNLLTRLFNGLSRRKKK
jgi:hypothetical protein